MDLKISKGLYSKDALNRAIFDLPSTTTCLVSELDNNYILEISSNNDLPSKEIESSFLKSLSDHQVRIELEHKFSTIRNLLVAKAIESGIDLTHMNLSND